MRTRRFGTFVRRHFEALEDRRLLAAAPVAVDDKYSVLAGEMLVSEPGVLANDYDADGDRLSVVLVGRPQHGAVALAPDGGFRYLPNAGFRGDDSFIYRATASDGESSLSVVKITVKHSMKVAYWSPSEGGNGHAYAVSSFDDATWNGSRAGAELLTLGGTSGTLATITSRAEFDRTAAHGGFGVSTYLGGYQDVGAADYSEPAGGWRWITGEPWSFAAWSLGEPNNWGAGENQLQTWYDGWNDIDDRSVGGAAIEFSNPAPVAFDLLRVVDASTTTHIDFADLLAAGRLLDPGSSLEILQSPTHGSLVSTDAIGTTYVPAPGFIGRDELVFRIDTPRGPSNPARLWLKVGFDELEPVTNYDVYWVTEDSPLDTAAVGKPSVLSNDTDADSDSLSASIVTAPQHGELALAADGHFVYRPAANYFGADYFQYQVSDGYHTSAPQTVGLAIDAVLDPPIAHNDDYELRGSYVVDWAHGLLANDEDPDSTITAHLDLPPTHGQLTVSTDGGFVYAPLGGFKGVDRFTYHANDSIFNSPPATVLLAVDALFGDSNLDGTVDLNDFGAIKANFGQKGATLAQGDLDGDADVDLADFGLLKENFGRTAIAAEVGAAGGLAFAPQATAAVDVRDLGWLRWAWDQRNGKPQGEGER